MKIKKIKANEERQLLIGMIISDSFIKRIYPIIKYEYFDSKISATVGKWAIDYFLKYSQAPGPHIQNIYDENKKLLSESEQEWISAFLDGLSKEYEKKGINENYIFDNSLKFFKQQRLKKSIEKIKKLLERGKVEEAEEIWIKSRTVQNSLDLGIDPLDEKTIDTVFEREQTRIKVQTGIESLDNLLGPIKSGWFVLFMGPQKRGKTWTFIWIAINLILQGFNVTFISFEGEDEDWCIRAWMSICSYVTEEDSQKLEMPYFISESSSEIKHKKIKRPVLNKRKVKSKIRKLNDLSKGKLILKSFPMGSAGMKDAEAYVDTLEAFSDHTTDVFIFDYIGIMEAPFNDRKEKYNWTGMRLKAFAHNKKAIVFSGHQGRRETLDKLNMGVVDVPEDVRLLGHVDILCGINQTDEEREMGVMRYSVLIHRHRKYASSKQAKVLQMVDAGQVALDSRVIKAPTVGIDSEADGEENTYPYI
jgi:hypothetical protein